jgi:hypothetical protein
MECYKLAITKEHPPRSAMWKFYQKQKTNQWPKSRKELERKLPAK